MNEILVNEIKKRASVIEKIEISTEETDSKYLTQTLRGSKGVEKDEEEKKHYQ